MSDMYTIHGLLDILKWSIIYTAIIIIPLGILMWRMAVKEEDTNKFIAKHWRLWHHTASALAQRSVFSIR